MKIFVAMHVFSNFGGIINHNEQLCAGLKELGHDVTFAYIKPTKTFCKEHIPVLGEGYEIGEGTGYPVHQGNGWDAPYYSLLNPDSIKQFVEDANKHDIVIWQSIFGFKNQETEEFDGWTPMIEDVNAKQIVVIHDANIKKLYSWIYKFQHKFTAIATVHTSAQSSADFLEVPRNMILNPQDMSKVYKSSFKDKKKSLLSLQTFKGMKRVDTLVSAIPYIDGHVFLAGDGIERNYMTSIDKCKPQYYCTYEVDPNATDEMRDKKIWDNALNNGNFEYLGFITEQKRDEILNDSMFLLDPSWSKSYGAHFNRVIVDAMMTGTVPIARNLGISDNEDGVTELLKPGKNYLMIPHDVTPKQFGDYVNKFFNISESEYDEIVETNFELIKQFDRKIVAQQFIDLAMGKNAGVLEQNEIGRLNPKIITVANKLWDHFKKSTTRTFDEFF